MFSVGFCCVDKSCLNLMLIWGIRVYILFNLYSTGHPFWVWGFIQGFFAIVSFFVVSERLGFDDFA